MKLIHTLALLGLFCLTAQFSNAQKLYGLAPGSPESSIYIINQSDPAVDFDSIGYTGFHYCGCMDQSPVDKKMYAICNRENENTNVLITIDLCTGVGTEVAVITDSSGVSSGILNWPGMSFRSDGLLFAYNNEANAPFTLDLGTGMASVVGNSPLVDIFCAGLTFSLTDSLYLFASTGSTFGLLLDQVTGQDYFITTYTDPCEGSSVDVHPVTGELWGVNAAPVGGRPLLAPSSFLNDLKIISLDGTTTTIGSLPKFVEAIAFAEDVDCSVPPAIPTMGEWSLWLFGLIVVTLLVVTLYEKRRIDVLERE